MTSQDSQYLPGELLTRQLDDDRHLRLATLEELDDVGVLLQEAFTDGCWVTDTYLSHLAQVRQRSAIAHVWVVADDEGLLAAVLTPKPQHLLEPEFTFNILGVGSRGRGLGLGRVLVEHSLDVARRLGFERVEIRSSPQMTAAHDLYRRLGFVRRPERETAVVDSGQRLHAFTYRITDPDPVPRITYQSPPRGWSFPGSQENTSMDISHLRPAEETRTDRATRTVLAPHWRLRVDPSSLRGRGAVAVAWLAGAADRIDWVPGAEVSIFTDGAGIHDWRDVSWAIATATGSALPNDDIDARYLVSTIHEDLVIGAETALFADSEGERLAALRVFYARLGWWDHRISVQSPRESAASIVELELAAVLLSLDFQFRAHLPRGSAAAADYPALFSLGQQLLRRGAFPEAVLRATGITSSDALAWGEPAPVEGIVDLREAWLNPEEAA